MGNALGSLLGQSRPSGTTAVAAFTATIRVEVTSILVCNVSGAAATFRLFHDDDGSTYDQTNALFYDVAIAANETIAIQAPSQNTGIMVAAGGSIGVRSSVASALTFSIYGVTDGSRAIR